MGTNTQTVSRSGMCGAEHLGLVGIGAKKDDPGEPHQVHFMEEKHAVAPPLIYLKVSEANIYGEKYWIPFL